MTDKVYVVRLTPENVEGVHTHHREELLLFETNLKGPAGAVIHVVLPRTAINEAVAAHAALGNRDHLFPEEAPAPYG